MASKDLIVITGSSCERGTLPLYRSQLAAAEIEFVIEDISDKPNLNGGGNVGYRVKLFRRWAEKYADYEKLVFSDGFDVTYYGKKEEVLKKIPTTHVLHAAERNCYPDSTVAASIRNSSPWRFINGGLAAGTPEQFLKWCAMAEGHHLYNPGSLDQWFMNLLIAEDHKETQRAPQCVIDDHTALFFCLYGGYEELEFENGLPVNTEYGTRPNFLHANGSWTSEEMFAKYERSLKYNQTQEEPHEAIDEPAQDHPQSA